MIIPAFNEEREILDSIRTVEKKLNTMGLPYELILVNDGSRDGTLAKMRECSCGHIKALSYDKNRGKGFAVRHGMIHAVGKYKLFMDVDLSTSLDAVDRFLTHMRNDEYDMIIGDRKSNPPGHVIEQPRHRRFLGNIFIQLSRLCVEKKIKDFTCGFKIFNQKSADAIFKRQRISNWAFDTELICIAIVHRLRIGEIPVVWRHHRGSNVHLIRDICTSLWGLLKIKWNLLRDVYR